MSDPAFDAALRRNIGRAPNPHEVAIAREALAPIRALHKPSVDECHCCRHCVECGGVGTGWPCDTARLIYTSEELSDE